MGRGIYGGEHVVERKSAAEEPADDPFPAGGEFVGPPTRQGMQRFAGLGGVEAREGRGDEGVRDAFGPQAGPDAGRAPAAAHCMAFHIGLDVAPVIEKALFAHAFDRLLGLGFAHLLAPQPLQDIVRTALPKCAPGPKILEV